MAEALHDLGVRPADRKLLEVIVGRIAKESCVGILWLRRNLEMQLANKETVSGHYRYEWFRKRKKALMKTPP